MIGHRSQPGAWLGLLVALALGCISVPTVVTSTASPVPESATPPVAATPTLAPPSAPAPTTVTSPIPEFPLNLGNRWEYSHHAEWEDTSADYRVVLEVTDTQIVSGYFVAETTQKAELVAGQPGLGFVTPTSKRFWYIVDGNWVYLQEDRLDVTQLEDLWLEYVFPLAHGSWFPYPDVRRENTGANPRYATATEPQKLPAGTFQDCYLIATVYNSGPTYRWFCSGIGMIGEKYHHNGTKFDYESFLESYSLQ